MVLDFRVKYAVEKIKCSKFVGKVGKSVILWQFSNQLTQIPDNDRLSRRIRSDIGRKGAVSSSGRSKKAIAREGFEPFCH